MRLWAYKPEEKDEQGKINIVKSKDDGLRKIDAILSKQEYLVGDYLTIADIYLFETFEYVKCVHLDSAKEYKSIMAHVDKIDSLEWCKKLKAGEQWMEKPFNGWHAYHNNL